MKRVVALALVLAAACTDSGPVANIAGTWRLRTIDGQQLPQAFDAASVVHEEVLEIESDGGYRQRQTRSMSVTPSTQIHGEVRGIWMLKRSEVTFASVAAVADVSFTAQWSGANQLRRVRQGAEWIYTRD